MAGDGSNMAFAFTFLVEVCNHFCDAEGVSVEWCLRDEAIGSRDPEDTSDAGGEAEEEEVPVEARWLTEWEFGTLGDEGGDVVVEVEEDGEEDGEGDGDEDIANADVPEVDEPAPVCGWGKGFAGR